MTVTPCCCCTTLIPAAGRRVGFGLGFGFGWGFGVTLAWPVPRFFAETSMRNEATGANQRLFLSLIELRRS